MRFPLALQLGYNIVPLSKDSEGNEVVLDVSETDIPVRSKKKKGYKSSLIKKAKEIETKDNKLQAAAPESTETVVDGMHRVIDIMYTLNSFFLRSIFQSSVFAEQFGV